LVDLGIPPHWLSGRKSKNNESSWPMDPSES
jgi:hypothetical protein